MSSRAIKAVPAVFLLALPMTNIGFWAQTSPAPSIEVRGGFVKVADGVRIHYLQAGRRSETGHKPAILFIPGWTMAAEIWKPQIKHFSKSYFVVAMDPRVQWESTKTPEGNYPEAHARDIQAVVDQLKLAPAVLVGWSMGVDDLAAYVDKFGCRDAAALVLVDGHPWSWEDHNDATMKRFFASLPKFEADRAQAAASFVRGMFKHPHSAEYLDRITQASLRTPTNTALALLVGVVAQDRTSALAKIDKPTLIVAAERPNQKDVEALHAGISGSRLEIIPGVGHALFADDPERFNSALETFLHEITATKN